MLILRSDTHTHARQRGQAAVEFAILVPVLVLLLLVAVDFGRLFFTFVQLQNSAREGAAYAAANPTDSAPGGGIWTRAVLEKNSQGQGGEGAVALAVSCARGAVGSPAPSPSPIACADAPGGSGPGNTVTVNVTERFSFITPFVNDLTGNNLTLRGSATAAVLGLAATGGTNPGGCTAGPAVAQFTYTITGKTVTVDANVSSPRTGENAITGYNWDWGDGTDPYLQEGIIFSHTYANLQAYTVSLRVENPCGALEVSHTIDLNPPPTPTPTAAPSGAPTPTPSPTPEPSPTPTASPTAAPTATPGACTMRVDFAFTVNNTNGKVAFTGSSTGQPNPASWHWSFGHNNATRRVDSGSTTEYDYPKPPRNGNDQYQVSLYGTSGSCQSPTVTKTVTLTGE
jgi:PKD repeat protein